MKYRYSFEEKKKYIGIAAACILIVIAGVIYVYNRGDFAGDASVLYSEVVPTQTSGNQFAESVGTNEDTDFLVNADDEDVINGVICVHICGAVKKPGIYELAVSSRIADAIEAAGGFTNNASKNYLNLAEVVTDGQKITVPTRREVKNGSVKGSDLSNAPGNVTGNTKESIPVNINTAGVEELMNIPGVGEAKAKSIIEYRQKNGGFKCKEDIMNITGIKEGVFSKISDYIIVN